MGSRLGIVMALLVVSLVARPASAWNDVGHMTVAKLAWEQLNAQQRKAAYQTLQALPFYAKFMAERPRPQGPDAPSEMEWAFLNAATWPDWLRDFAPQGRRPDPKIGKYHHGPWHFTNLRIIAPDDAAFFAKKGLDPTTAKQETVLTALKNNVAKLQAAEDTPEKAVALCWLLHLAGDIHQPLHCAAYFSRKDYPHGDEGGNAWWVNDGTRPAKLHAYWDELPGTVHGFGVKPYPVAASAKIYAKVKENAELLTREPYGRANYGQELKRKAYSQWADESLALAKGRAYAFNGAQIGGLAIPDFEKLTKAQKLETTAKAPPLPGGYEAAATQTARRQLALAGHRLADQLQAVYPQKAANP